MTADCRLFPIVARACTHAHTDTHTHRHTHTHAHTHTAALPSSKNM